MDSNWQLGGVNINDSSLRLVSPANSSAVCQANILESSSCSAATVVDSLCPTMWDQVSGSQNLGFSNVHPNESTSNVLGNGLGGMVSLRDGFDNISGLAWGSPNDIMKGGTFLPGAADFLSQSLPHFPADSGFIERAARYSCFSGGNFGEILNPFSATETSNLEPRGLAPMQRSQEAFGGQTGPPMFEAIVQKNGMNMAEISKRACLSADPGVSDGSLLKNEKNNDCFGRSKSNNEAQMGLSDPNGDSEEAEYSSQGDPTELEGAVGASSRGVGLKKRKRSCQDSELDQGMGFSEHQAEAAKKKGKQNSSPTYNKSGGKDGKQEPKASDSPKEEYIHVRARRGQATNSHSLAERVRREKISERMKFLQDLVPGCSKVTGKAVMLDEIINYVQSLQRQVEFLSMKLATVNPQLDCNLERLLSEDLRAGPSSSLPYPPDMPMGPPFLQSQGIPQTSIQLLGNPMDALQRSMDLSLTATRGGYREPSSHQVSTNWGDELHNALQMGLITTAPLSSHEISGSLPEGQTKADI